MSFKEFGEVSATAFLNGAEYVIQNGVIRIPVADLENVIVNKSTISLIMNGENLASIIFLPRTEQEPFPFTDYYIDGNGNLVSFEKYNATDFIDIANVTQIALRVRVGYTTMKSLYCYDENRNPVRALAGTQTGTETKFFVPDGSYRYIRACGFVGSSYQTYLSLTFRDRG